MTSETSSANLEAVFQAPSAARSAAPLVGVVGSSRARLSLWVVLLRVFALFVTAEVSGLAHLGTDLVEAMAGADHVHEHEHEDCEDEESGHECPPGCPNCHHAHSAVVLGVLAPETHLEPLLGPERPTGFVPYSEMVRAGADPASLYRPPRLPA
ncbi:MAG: hypothetical protein QM778_30035 [Myxococcales bacterium]